ncbi:GEVED domain-containing protein [Parachryseolinea silvisoli]|uniref:GEVED domain-containing protein n=1 Tax=Parachryseolinea silvisoli TaxID=2873601 RepID=UPI002265999B|nr:GEVED domain-containing protein [Parachryseolinea silvisoli]MCD9019800.1 T9SS type A sorting domain-containing protein [Parachryseolinea silvisoli]
MKKRAIGLSALFVILFYCCEAFSQPSYCVPTAGCPSGDAVYIASVKFSSLQTASTCSGYTLFPESGTSTTTVERTATYGITVGVFGSFFNPLFNETSYWWHHVRIFIDFNGDGDFDDAGETIVAGQGSQVRPIEASITIPADARLGKTRLRVRQRMSDADNNRFTACINEANSSDKAYDTEDYTITIAPRNTGTPSCPTTYTPAPNAANVVRSPDYHFAWTGASGGSNTRYDVYLGSSPAALTAIANDVTAEDGFAGSFDYTGFLNQGSAYYYRIQPRNENGPNAGCTVQTFTTAATSNVYYCKPTATCSPRFNEAVDYYYIKSIALNTLNQTSSCPGIPGAYTQFAGPTTTLTKGQSYTLDSRTFAESISGSTSFPQYGGCSIGYLAAWFDFNHNGSFDDAGEFFPLSLQTTDSDEVMGGNCVGNPPSVSIAIPAGAVTGATRMRVRASFYTPWTAGDACTAVEKGETEDYTVTIQPAAACSNLTASFTKQDNTASSGVANGSIIVTPTGGTAPYTITWASSASSAVGFQPTGLEGGVYIPTVRDQAGCLFTLAPIYVLQVPPLEIAGVAYTHPGCQEGGTVRVDVQGGVGPYSVQWSGSLPGNLFVDNLAAGTYQATITDSRGATVVSPAMTLETFSVTPTVTDARCSLGASGEISLTVHGGQAPYDYAWRDLNTGYPIEFNYWIMPAARGAYAVTVTDAAGCSTTLSNIRVNAPYIFTATAAAVPPNCNGNGSDTGEVWVTAQGKSPYRYELFVDNSGVPVPATFEEDDRGFRFTNLEPGWYSVIAYDDAGCQAEFVSVVVEPLQELDAAWGYEEHCGGAPVDVQYGGYIPGMNFVWYADAVGEVPLDTAVVFHTPILNEPTTYYLANYKQGCRSALIPYILNITPTPPKPVIAYTGSTTFCADQSLVLEAPTGYAGYKWSDGSTTRMLAVQGSGAFTVQAWHAEGCKSPASDAVVTAVRPKPARPVITVSGETSFCTGQSITLTAPAGFDHYRWSDGPTLSQRVVGTSGDYRVRVQREGECESDVSDAIPVRVEALPGRPVVQADGDRMFCEGGVVRLSAPTGYSRYQWSNGETTQSIDVMASGSYTVVVGEACKSPASIPVAVDVLPAPPSPEAIVWIAPDRLQVIGASPYYAWELDGVPLEIHDAEILVTTGGLYRARGVTVYGCLSPEEVSYQLTLNVTGIDDPSDQAWTVYPVPSNGLVTLQRGTAGVGAVTLQVTDAWGRRIRQAITTVAGDHLLDLRDIPGGVYYVALQQGTHSLVRKIIITKGTP